MRKLLRCLGSAVLVGAVCWRVDWGQVGSAFARASGPVWTAALAVFLLLQVLSSWRWHLLSHAIGLGGRLASYTRDYFLGMFFNLLLPTSVGGDVVRVLALAGRGGPVPSAGRRLAAAVSVLADRVNGVLVLVAVACAGTLACPVALTLWMPWCVAVLGAGGVLGLAALPLLPRLLAATPFQDARFERPRRMLNTARVLSRRPGPLLGATALSFLVQAGNVIVVWMIGWDLGLPVPAPYYAILVPLVSLLTLLPVSLNGMGLREGSTVLLLAPLGVGTGEALTLSLLTFAVFTAAGMCGGLCLLFGGRNPSLAATDEPEVVARQQPLAA